MLMKALVCGCLVLGLTAAAPQQRNRQYDNNQYNRENGQYDGSNNQYDRVNNQYDNSNNQDNGGNNQIDNNNVDFGTNNYENDNRHFLNGGRNYDDSRRAYITQYDYENDGSGNYVYNVSQSDGIYNDQVGKVDNQGTNDESSVVYGHYAYPGPDGNFYYTEYVADKDGFRPAGNHIPRSASVGRVGQLGIPSAAIASLAGGGLG